MNKIDIKYNNVNIKKFEKELDKKKINEINSILKKLVALKISREKSDLEKIYKTSDEILKNNNSFVILGTGGSNLGARALVNILYTKSENKIYFMDNIDPISFKRSISELNINKTCFIIISKSGYTPETLSQFASIIDYMKLSNLSDQLVKNFIVITQNNNNPLRAMAMQLGCTILEHNPDIGGRYSVFSNVGLLPACIMGLDIKKIRQGASDFLDKIENESYYQHIVGAYGFYKLQLLKLINLNVLMTYGDALFFFGKWYLQLWAESIGKKNKGITPIHSIGTTDQHSQLQLYLDGPQDKFFTLILSDHQNKGLRMNKKILSENKLNYLAGKKMGDLMHAEQKSTLNTLINNKLPTRSIFLKEVNEFAIGQLMAYFIGETVAICNIMGVDPFSQPAVEEGKKLTKKYLSS